MKLNHLLFTRSKSLFFVLPLFLGSLIAKELLFAFEVAPHTGITQVAMQNPSSNEVWLIDSPHTLTCTTSTDEDLYRENPNDDWVTTADSVTHYWSGGGSFDENDNIGTTVEYIAGDTAGNDTITVHANDDYAGAGNTAIADENATTDSETVEIVAPEVHEVGFTADNELYFTPTDEWDDGSTKIQDPIWVKDDTAAEKAAKSHVCWTKGTATITAKVKCRVPTALTEAASFQLGAITNAIPWSWAACTIAVGQTESSEAESTCADSVQDSITAQSVTWEWKFRDPNGANQQRSLNSSSSMVYVTWDDPKAAATIPYNAAPTAAAAGAEATVKRIAEVCQNCQGADTAKEVADGIHTNLSPLFSDPPKPIDVESDDWDLMYGELPTVRYVGECDEHARFMVRQLLLIGSSGTWYNTYASTDATVDSSESLMKNGKKYWLQFDFDADGVFDNYFEGSVASGGHFYTVTPKYSASTKLGLLLEMETGGIHQLGVRRQDDDWDGTILEYHPDNPIDYPNAP